MFLIISILAQFISVVQAIFNWRLNRNAVFLAMVFFIFSTYGIAQYFVLYGNSALGIAIFFNNFSFLWMLIGPLLYFYVRGTLTDTTGLSLKDSWHFIPAILQFINLVPYLLTPFSYKLEIGHLLLNNLNELRNINIGWIFPSGSNFIARTLSLLLYLPYLLKVLWDYAPSKQTFKKVPYKQYLFTYRWLLILNGTMLIGAINFLIMFFLVMGTKLDSSVISHQPLYYLTAIAFLLLPISMLIFPQVLYGMPIPSDHSESRKKQQLYEFNSGEWRVIGVAKTEDPFMQLAIRMMLYLKNEKPYLDPAFSMNKLSEVFNVPQRHLSYCFRNIIKSSFGKLICELRIAHAKQLLKNNKNMEHSINDIAKRSGFLSRSKFDSDFNSETGLSPNEFLVKEIIGY